MGWREMRGRGRRRVSGGAFVLPAMSAATRFDVYKRYALRCMLSGMSHTSIKRTNINLDSDLVDAAAEILGTARTTDTVHAALRSVIARASRGRLVEREFDDLTPEQLNLLRAPRHAA